MYAKTKAQGEVLTALKKAIGKKDAPTIDMLETPPDLTLGDTAFPCFALAKAMKRSPVEIATELSAKIGPTEFIDRVVAVGPYVNFFFKKEAFTARVLKEVKVAEEKYGFSTLGAGHNIIVEYAQPNTHKEFHVGHLRNALLGESIARVMRANGYKVVGVSYPGDIGAHVAKVIWAIQKFHADEEILLEDRAKRLQEIYAEAVAYLEAHPEAQEEVNETQRRLEAREEPETSLWKETREWSLAEFREIFAELGVHPDKYYYESEVEDEGKELVKMLLTKGVAKKSEGATIVDLNEEGLGAFLILKSDGSSLYATKDIALALRKDREYEPDRQIFVVDNRQTLYFKQLFATLRKIGVTTSFNHIAYDMVTLPEGAMSSRKGNIITYRDLRATAMQFTKAETLERHPEWAEKEIEGTARGIADASIAFVMLRQDPNSIITFDMKEALATDGFTGAYLLYSMARIERMFEKAGVKPKYHEGKLGHEKEYALARALAEYPEVVQKTAQSFQVSAIATYAFDLAKLFSEYYHEVRVLDEEDKTLIASRLALCSAVLQTLKNACDLLTIKPIKHM